MDETVGLVLQARDAASAVISKVKGEVTGLGSATGTTTSRMGGLSAASTKLGGVFGTLKGHIGQLMGGLGIVGLGGALYGLGKFISGAVGDAESFGLAAGKIASITGMATDKAQMWTAVLQHFGVQGDAATKVVGMLTKNIGLHTKTLADAQKFQAAWGISLIDSNGHVRDSLDIFNSLVAMWNDQSIPASQKVAAMTQLMGRQWQSLLPLLQGGTQGMADAAAQAKALGLDQGNLVKAAQDQQKASEDWNSTLSGLKVTIGAQLLPVMTEFMKSMSTWVQSHGPQIKQFFADMISWAKGVGGFIKDSVLPTIQGLASGAQSLWDSIPGPLRDLLVKGFVADRTIKFLFGFSLADIGKDVVGSLISSIGQKIFMRGSATNPEYVKVLGAMPGAAGSTTGVMGGGMSKLITAVSLVSIVGDALAVFAAIQNLFETTANAQHDLQGQADAAAQQTATAALANLANLNATLGNQGMWEALVTNTAGAAQTSSALVNLGASITSNGTLNSQQQVQAIAELNVALQIAISRGWTDAANAIGSDISRLQHQTLGPPLPAPGLPGSPYLGPPAPTPKAVSGDPTPGQGHYDSELGMWVPGAPTKAPKPPAQPTIKGWGVKPPKVPGAGSTSTAMTVSERINAVLEGLPAKFSMSSSALQRLAALAGVSSGAISKAWTTMQAHAQEAMGIVRQLPKNYQMTLDAAKSLAHGTDLTAQQVMDAFSRLSTAVAGAVGSGVSAIKAVLAGLPTGFKMTTAALANLAQMTGKGAAAISKAWVTMQAHAAAAEKVVAKLPAGYQMTLEAAQAMAKGTGATAQDIMDAFTRMQSGLTEKPHDEPVYRVGADGKVRFAGFRHFGGGAAPSTAPGDTSATPGAPKTTPDTSATAQPGLKGALAKAMAVNIHISPAPIYVMINGRQVAQATTAEQNSRYSVYTSPEGPYPGT